MRLVIVIATVLGCGSPQTTARDAAGAADGASEDDSATASDAASPDVAADSAPMSNDPFDPASCGGTPPSAADLLTLLGSATRSVLATATIQMRTRSCTGMTCGAWSSASNWQTHFLTYSGGVTTRYMDIQADTRLVVYNAVGVAKLSVQHVTFTQGNYPDSDGIVFDAPPALITSPLFRAYNVMPQFPSDYLDLQLGMKNGELVLGTGCARFTATVYGATEPYTTGYAALYRW